MTVKTLAGLSRDLASGAVSSRALVEQSLARIAGGEGPRAFVRVFRDAALAAADASDRLRKAGVVPSPLAGVPVAVKDLCDIAGVTTLAGSATRKGDPPAERDAPVAARLRAAGAVIMGTTNMTEFALGGLGINPHFGDCRNPWDRATGRIPGGSSSGTAVAIADDMIAAGLGTDTMGSVRIPAGLCGLTGFKPTAARVPRDGIFPLSITLDSVGPLGRSVECCALVDAIFAGEAPVPPRAVPLAGLRFGVPKTLMLDGLDAEVAKAFERALATLSAAGVKIEEFEFPEVLEIAAVNRTRGLSMLECYGLHRQWLASRRTGYDPRILFRIESAASLGIADYYEVLQWCAEIAARSAQTTDRFDAVVMPTLPVIAPPIARFLEGEGKLDGYPILIRNTSVANYLDRCALTIPCHEAGTAPVGFTLMGERMADRRLLGVGVSVEAAIGTRS